MSQRRASFRGLCLASLAVVAVGLASCQAVAPEERPGAATPAQEVVITADAVAKLAPGEKLIIDRAHDTAYTFDFANAPIDFSRISMLMEDGHQVAMDTWLNSSAYGKKLLASPNRTFRLAAQKQTLQALPSLKERNSKVLERLVQNIWICDVVITVEWYEILICTPDGCYYEYGEVITVEITCYDDGTEP